MKTLAVLACLALASCAGTDFSITSPYGDASSKGGLVTITPKPIVYPEK